jgi:hypothetical protein
MKNGTMNYGPKKYHTLFLIGVDSLDPETSMKLHGFVESGGRIFCVESVPAKSLGWSNHEKRDAEVTTLVERMKSYPDRFILLKKPDTDFIDWYRTIQETYGIEPYIKIGNPGPFLMQNRYHADDGSELIYIINSHLHNSHTTSITFSKEITRNRQGWVWDPEDGKRYRIVLEKDNSINLDMGPAGSVLFVFDKNKRGPGWNPLPAGSPSSMSIEDGWNAVFSHCHNGSVKNLSLGKLQDLKEIPEFASFAGIVTYRNNFNVDELKPEFLNLGRVAGLSLLTVNGKECGMKWYGRRIFAIDGCLKRGINTIEIQVITTMGNYMKSLTDNPIAQYWTNEKNKIQPMQPMGLIGPVTIY